ncbi:MAG TPA: DUF5686 and carboxypeptidase regulatory-like domain-containing protein, partial [Phnomibacter sp.]|nr:DUF5686 and carboxypeptidase regulatory-like domain-containing protein [Phnomibacter sp.]
MAIITHTGPTRFIWSFVFMLCVMPAIAQQVSGTVTGPEGNPLPYASVYVKGNTRGTVANAEGQYMLELEPGTYTLVCAYVGYQRTEHKITLGRQPLVQNFTLALQQTQLAEVVVKANAEDPAYAIIRNAIKKRKEYLNEVNQWQVMVYIKGLIRSQKMPESIFGVKLKPNRDVIDSSGKGILYFSESLTRYTRRRPEDFKEEIISAKVAGNSNGFGFNSPAALEVNLYENNIEITGLSSRGFVSPIADAALGFYKYKYLGSYFEEGREVLRVAVIPRRKYEPLFAGGYIEIMDGTWRLHGVSLYLTKESQIEVVDSLHLRQEMFPVNKQVWMPQKTEIAASFGLFGFKALANFVAVYSDYDFTTNVASLLRSRVIRTADTSANRRTVAFWDSIRPMPLTDEERLDYLKKDTLEQKMKSPAYLDSIDRITNKVGVGKLLLRGQSFISRKNKTLLELPGLITGVQYNTVEGWAYELAPNFRKWGDTGAFSLSGRFRYAFGIQRPQASLNFGKTLGKDFRKRWRLTLGGGRNIYQINPDNPITAGNNTIGTLLYTVNHMKLYEKGFVQAGANRTLNNGLRIGVNLAWEDRTPLQN